MRRAALAAGALAVVAALAWGLWTLRLPEALLPPTVADEALTVPGFGGAPAIAVLPFDNLSGDPDQEYFSDGISESLIARLSSWRSFPVIARNSSFVYKGRAVDVKQVSRELGVRYLVEGSVQRAADRVRITAQLIDATTGHHVWAETYDRELRDIFALQDEITEAIVVSLSTDLLRVEMERAVRQEPQNIDAYDLDMRGRWHFWELTKQDNARARSFFEQAAELDPRLAAAFTGLALTHYVDIFFQWSDEPDRSIAELTRAAQRSVALDAKDPFGQIVLGFAYSFAGAQDRMIAALERALELNPSLPAGHYVLGSYLAISGRPDDGIPHLETAMRLSPRDPMTSYFVESIAVAHFAAGRYEEAVDWAQRSIRGNPGDPYPWSHGVLATSYAHLGRVEDARKAFDEFADLQPGISPANLEVSFSGANPEFLERYLEGLRIAGLKDSP
jgi:adenylate cyclase